MDQDTADTAPDTAPAAYAYKSTLMGGGWSFSLADDALHWTYGATSGRVPYADIRRIRLAFRPVTMQNYRFLAEIWSEKSPKLPIASSSWKSLMEQERLDEPYSRFIVALHERIAKAGGRPRLEAGAVAFLYWPGLIVFVAIAVAVAALIVRALQQGEMAATLFLAGFFALLLWQLGGFFRRNLPRRYTLDAVPDDLLPKPSSWTAG
jgi:hypothetical protein